jgi:hypothetical protein
MVKRKPGISLAQAERLRVRAEVHALASTGVTRKTIARRTKLGRDAIRLILKRKNTVKGLIDRPRTGAPSIITSKLKRDVKHHMLKSDYGSKRRVATELRRKRTKIGPTTVWKISKMLGLRARKRRYKWTLTAADRKRRVAFATNHRYDSTATIRHTVYLDEVLFVCNVKSQWVWVEDVTHRRYDEPGKQRRNI